MDSVCIIEKLDIKKQMENGYSLSPKSTFKGVSLEKINLIRNYIDKERKSVFWQEHLKNHPKDFNGKLMSLISIEIIGDILNLKFHETSFSRFLFDREIRRSNKFDSGQFNPSYCSPISVGAMTLTEDGYILFGKRVNTTIESDYIMAVPGGYLDPEADALVYDKGIGYSAMNCLMREMKEEILTNSFKSIVFHDVIYSYESMQPMIAVEIEIPYTSKEMMSIVRDNEELCNICVVSDNINDVAQFFEGKRIAVHDAWKTYLHFVNQN